MPRRKSNGSNHIDVHVGSRLRMRRLMLGMRRLMLGMSQEKLGEAFGLTFQQVQKYEKGTNRIGSGRLQHAADILGVTVPFFFEGAPGGHGLSETAPSPAYVNEFVASEEGLRLIKALTRIARSARQRIVHLVEEIAARDGR